MKVHIRAFANFRDILGNDRDIEIQEGSTAGDLLQSLISSNRNLRAAIFDEAGNIREYIIIMKNRKNIEYLQGLNTALDEGDEVAILPPVAGG
ncbi:MAG: ubiquitin-like small modifier protein 1 [Methanotrichaceae archaeon]